MCVEIEAKLKVDSLPEVERKLGELGAEFVAEQEQTDHLFDDAARTLTSSDRCLRIRRQSASGSQQFILAYKGAKESSNFKKRQEIQVEIKDADTAQNLLTALAYEKVLTVEKNRRLWRVGGCEVALDHLPTLGDFVEIEGPTDKMIADVQKSLGLAGVAHIAKSYAQLVKERNRGGE
jgi:predicted adenylyl cyclase CyaB